MTIPNLLDLFEPKPTPQQAAQAPQGAMWDRLRGYMGSVESWPTRLRTELQEMAKDPYNTWIGMVGTGELGEGMPVSELARALHEGGGFTFDPRAGKMHEGGGYAVANPPGAKSVVLNPGEDVHGGLQSAYEQNRELLKQPGMMLGGWHDTETGKKYLEVSQVHPDKDAALKIARSRNEKAIFDLGSFENVPNPHYRGELPKEVSLPREEVTPTAWALAHHTAGTSDEAGWMENIKSVYPELATRLQQTPELRTKLYEKARQYQPWAEKMRPQHEAVADYHEMNANSPESGSWYSKWWNTIKDALGPEMAHKFTRASSILSVQQSPEMEAESALKGLQLHSEGRKLTPEAVHQTQEVTRRAQALFQGGPWAQGDLNKWLPSRMQNPKTSDYLLARMGQTERSAVDRHMLRYYFPGEEFSNKTNVPDAVKEMVQARMREDATAAGEHDVPKFQAALWAKQSGYKSGYGNFGATAEDWVRSHLYNNPELAPLLQKFPGLEKLRQEGLVGEIGREAQGLPPSSQTRSQMAELTAKKRAATKVRRKGPLSESE